MPWSFIKFSQLIHEGNVWRSVWRICMWILGLKGLTSMNWSFSGSQWTTHPRTDRERIQTGMPWRRPAECVQYNEKLLAVSVSTIHQRFKVIRPLTAGRPQITMTTTRFASSLPAVLVKTRVWVGCTVSRAHKTWSRSLLLKDFHHSQHELKIE